MNTPLPSSATLSRGVSTRPASLGGVWTRRAFLGTLSSMALAGIAGCSSDSAMDQQDFGGKPNPGGGAGGADPQNLTPTPPFSLTSRCELSEDYYLIKNRQVDATKDTVVAYSRADGEVEAMILQDGIVKQAYRDSTQPGGWNEYALPDADGVTSMVAGISNVVVGSKPIGSPTLKAFYPVPQRPFLTVAVERPRVAGQPAAFDITTDIPWSTSAGPLQVSVGADGGLLVAAIVPSSAPGRTDAQLWYWTDSLGLYGSIGPSWGRVDTFEYNEMAHRDYPGRSEPWSAIIARPEVGIRAESLLTVFLPGGSYTADPGNVAVKPLTYLILKDGQQPSSQLVPFGTARPAGGNWDGPGQPAPGVTVSSIEYLTVLGSTYEPTAVVRANDSNDVESLWILTRNDTTFTWTWISLTLPDGTGPTPIQVQTALTPAPPSEGGKLGVTAFLDIFLVSGDLVSVIRQAPQGNGVLDGTKPVYCRPIPLHPGVTLMTSQAGVSTGNELLLVGTDGSLQTLTKDPKTQTWSEGTVHLPASELQQVSAYRVSLTLSDAWNIPLSGPPHTLQVTADSPAAALANGEAYLLSQTPTTFTTDAHGQVIFGLVADGLSAPGLRITGPDLPSPVTLYPSGPLNTYLQGSSTLNGLDPLTTGALTHATTTSGQLVVPANAKNVDQAATNMNLAATWGAKQQSSVAAGETTARRRDGLRDQQHLTRAEVEGFVDTLDNWKGDVFHAIKKGVARVTGVLTDAAGHAFQLACDAGRWVDSAIQIVVNTIADAAHAVHAFFSWLGSKIMDAVNWLEAEVIGTLRDAAALAAQYETWIGQALTQAADHLRKDEADLDNWLGKKQAALTGELTARAKAASSQTLSTMSTSSVGQVRPRSGPPGGSANSSINTPHSSWLFEKIKNELTGTLTTNAIGDADTLFTAFGTAAAQAVSEVTTAFDKLLTFFKGVVTHPEDVRSVGVQNLFEAMADLTAALFTFIRGVAKTTMTLFAEVAEIIPAMLDTPLNEALGIVGKLLSLVGLGQVTIGRVVTLLLAFPTVLAYKLVHGSKAVPFGLSAESAGGQDRRRLADAAADLQFCAGAVLGVWAGFDTLSAAFTATGAEGPVIFTAMDIAAPVAVTVLTTPGTNGGQPFASPPVGADDESQMNFAAWILGLLPALSVAGSLYIDQKSAATSETKGTWKDSLLFLTSGCGTGALVTASIANGLDTEPTAASYAGATLNNMANVVAPCLSDKVVEASEGLSAVIACALTAVCGLLGAVIYGIEV